MATEANSTFLITQKEFDELTPSEKASGMYKVDVTEYHPPEFQNIKKSRDDDNE